jgi:hypothetical protein
MASKSIRRRGGKCQWLVGTPIKEITGNKLPSNKQVLSRFIDLHINDKRTIGDSAKMTASELLQFWEKASIPAQKDFNIINKIKKLYNSYISLKKNSKRDSNPQKIKRKQFEKNLNNLFDVAHANALNLITIPEDKLFLLAQREEGRRGTLGSVDKKKLLKDKSKIEKTERFERFRERVKRKDVQDLQRAELVSSTSDEMSTMSSKSSDSSCECVPASVKRKLESKDKSSEVTKKLRNRNIITPQLASTLDRTKVSNRKATFILSAAAKSMGQNLENIAISEASIRRSRRQNRQQISNDIRAAFSPDVPLCVHWDGKMLPDLTGKTCRDTVDRLAVLVSGGGIIKLLGVPKLQSSTGAAQAEAVFELLTSWDIIDKICFMGFDTTASNTGWEKGTCVLLQQKLNKKLIGLPCRHHVLEIVVGKIFDGLIGPSTGPNISLFQRFSDCWPKLNKSMHESGIQESHINNRLQADKEEIVSFINEQLSEFQPRDDYRELLTLSLLFLGVQTAEHKPIKIRAPGAVHRARWMAKIIYSLKIYLFRSQFNLKKKELTALRELNVFVIKIYLKFWFTAQSSVMAPKNDLELIKLLKDFEEENETVSKIALKSFSNHLWYLDERLVALSFFDDRVTDEVKCSMTENLSIGESEDESKGLPRVKFNDTIFFKDLPDFVNRNTLKFFELLNIPHEFLLQDPPSWAENENYLRAKQLIQQIKVVNDVAERGVALITEYNSVATTQEDQKQFLLQVVEDHRRRFPTAKKSEILKQY